MLRISSFTGLSITSQLIDMANEDEFGDGESGGNETNLSNLFALKKYTKTDYLTSRGTKRGSSNTKKGIKATKGLNYLTQAAKKLLTTYNMRLHRHLSFNTLI